ncbi:MAG: EAL domain-containing protein [Saccharothrix sp.]|nr:EAL domain-containing protein [Saccharothrix sp.]
MSPPARTRRQDIAREWMLAVYPTAYVPMSPVEIELYLLDLVHLIVDAVQADPFSPEPVDVVGGRLVEAHFTGPETLQRTVSVLGRALLFAPELADVPDLVEKVVAILGGVSTGYATALRLDAFDQQEAIKRALLTANLEAERVLKVSEARFREVFDSSAFGIAITDLDGTCVEVNGALAEMVDRDRAGLAGTRLLDLVEPDDVEALAAVYRDVGEGRKARVRDLRRLLREDGEPVWAHLAVSLLRDADGAPAYHVTMVEDVSELHLLQKNLDFQLLHDSLTGLSNRQRFATRLEAMHGASRAGITLYHLGLDAFAAVNNGLGLAVGDRLLIEVGHRLEAVVAAEDSLVARMSGDEFAIVVDNAPTTPSVPDLVERINGALRGPLPGGVALSATIGVIDRPPAGWEAAEILRAADATLRRAKSCGKRQWLTYDRETDRRFRERQARAARMAGALADRELEVEYQPVVDPADLRVLGHLVRLRWDDLGHDECVGLAEETGLALDLGQWALREAAADAVGAPPAAFGSLYVELSPMESRDEDLVRAVTRALADTGLPASRLRVFLDTRAMLGGTGDDNAQVLRDNGIATGLARFNGGQAELSLLDELPVDALVLDPSVVRRLAERPGSFLRAAVAGMVGAIRSSGVTVVAPDITTDDRLSWWTGVEVDAAFGDHLAPAVPGYELSGD